MAIGNGLKIVVGKAVECFCGISPDACLMAGTFVLAKCVILVRTLAASIGIDGLHTLEEVSGSPPPVAV